MKIVTAAAVYARISSDQTGEGLGVQRQLEDCRKLAAERGWTIAEEYVDNDISAYRGQARPEYARMLTDIAEGRRDAVIAYHQDRLTRRPMEWEQFVDLCDKAGVEQLATVTSDINFGNDNGMLIARITAAVAANESARKSARINRKIQQNVELGKPNGGAQRPFGYDEDKLTVRESEAEIVRAVVDRFLAGESVRSLASWMNEQEIPTTAGGTNWRTSTLRGILRSGRIAGLRDHHGEAAGPAAWPALVSEAKHHQILAMFATRMNSGRRAPRRYLLSGLLRCGKCGSPLYSAAREDRRRYVCLSGPDHRGCGRLTVVAQPVEELISTAVLMRLDTPVMGDTLSGRAAADERQSALLAELQTAQSKMTELMEMWAAGEISRPELRAARTPLEARVENAQRQLDQITGTHALDGLVGHGEELAAGWDALNLDRQVAIVRAVLDYATILPGVLGARTVDPSRVVPSWQL
ncbi:recombinase family protein [Cryobacterium sp. TMT2-18-3]|uniref:recombinase family protein n=1 Tax=unclassified Cryobacterium TaxID=2649013 RepID=UPI00106AAA3B|nr:MULTISPECIES: recombinase family protein [unclassified Cryobacterium]TFC30235.1 recombinase family protein [Cryobacterium sp. TMT2-18-2]TFC63541.1 recombinase family protein [Cryobacterium sp. TMT2-18-3]